MAIPKWTDERTAALTEFVGSESPVSYNTVVEAADQLETSPRSVASKLRKMGHEVESSASVTSRAFTESQENTLRSFVTDNSGAYTYGQIAEAFEDGEFSSKQIQGKLLSMQLTEHVKPTPKVETPRSFTEAEEAVKGEDKEKMEAATKKLTDASGALAQKLYAEQQDAAGKAGAAEGAEAGNADDGVVDAEFEEVKDEK